MVIVRFPSTFMFSKLLQGVALIILFVRPVHAAVIINEFFPNPSSENDTTEWIELYNTGPDTVDLGGWKLDDIDGGTSPYEIASGSSIAALSFLVFEKATTDIALNNSGDSVRLLNAQEGIVDSYSYSSTAQDVSIGRTINGGGSWVTCTSPTKGSSNNCSEPSPTATNMPTKTPTQAPQATNTPIPTQTTTPTKKLTPTKTPTPKTSPSPTTTAAAVLGAEVSIASSTATPSGGLKQVLPLIIALLLVAIGLAIIAFVLVWKKRKLQ